ncbi:MAG: tetratricopeptide repeat protein [Kiloniellaceae bacterium]
MTGSRGRALSRFTGVLLLAGFTVACASPQSGPTVAPAGYGKDQVSRAERLVQYCDRLEEKREYVTALGLCARAHEMDPDNPETLMKVAALLRKLDRAPAAAQTYGVLLEQHPGYHEARYNLGKLYMESGEDSLAAMHFNQAMRSNPEDPRPYNALGIIRDQAGEHQAAQALYRSALQVDPNNFSVRNNLGLSLALSGQRDEAIDVLAELAVDPEAGQTVLRNLELAYAAQPVPPGGGPAPAAVVREETPAALEHATSKQGDMAPALGVPKTVPVEIEVLDSPPDRPSPFPFRGPAVTSPAVTSPAVMAPEVRSPAIEPAPSAPAARSGQGAPLPLYLPKPSASKPAAPGRGDSESVILAAAERLMRRPDWADFEPGSLIGRAPAPRAAAAEHLMPHSAQQRRRQGVTAAQLGLVPQPGRGNRRSMSSESIFAGG